MPTAAHAMLDPERTRRELEATDPALSLEQMVRTVVDSQLAAMTRAVQVLIALRHGPRPTGERPGPPAFVLGADRALLEGRTALFERHRDELGVHRFVHALPDGYDTVLAEEGSGLSAGERQLTTIARAFLSDPALLLLDEATSSVDTRTELLLPQAMSPLRSDRTSFVIAHRLSTIRDAARILVMREGRTTEQGIHDERLGRRGAPVLVRSYHYDDRGELRAHCLAAGGRRRPARDRLRHLPEGERGLLQVGAHGGLRRLCGRELRAAEHGAARPARRPGVRRLDRHRRRRHGAGRHPGARRGGLDAQAALDRPGRGRRRRAAAVERGRALTARRPRGQERRAALVDAAVALLVDGGFGAVSHRAVATRAGLPLAATTYYFSSLDDLVATALAELAERWLLAAQHVVQRLPARLADRPALAQALAAAVLEGPDADDGAVLTMYERFLQAGRSPHLRSVVTAYGTRLDALLLDVLRRASPDAREATVRQVLAALDGSVLRALAEGRPVFPAAVAAVEPLLPVPPTLDELLHDARTGPPRLGPHQVVDAVARGALLVDTRTETQRQQQGDLPSAVVVDRTVLEWRLDPRSDWRIPEATGPDLEVVVVCRQGYSSSLAAASLRALGLHRATDLEGGVEAWLAAGLPVTSGPGDVRS